MEISDPRMRDLSAFRSGRVLQMLMYELWKVTAAGKNAERLEDEGGPVLFPRVCDAEEYFRGRPDSWGAECRVTPVTVGLA
jgi:hypothetical protein